MAERPTEIEHSFVVEGECHGWRLDRFLVKKIPRLSRTRVQRVIRGECWIDGRPAKPSQVVAPGQVVTFRRPAPIEPDAPRELPVLLADDAFYVLDKPAGIAMHPTAKFHFSTVTSVLRERFPGEPLQITHRLDLETSGALLIARTRDAAVALKRAFARRKVRKRYLAIVRGELDGEGVIDRPLGLDVGGLTRVKMAVRAEDDGGLPARTRWRALEKFPGHTLVECAPETGRQHQIRAHLDAIGFPIAGDKLYPDARIFVDYQDRGWDAVAERLPLRRHALHAAGLEFPHPSTGEPVAASSPLPADLRAFLDRLPTR
ncbi:MAG TPA: RluA family pseudouridine synthase [Polyangia bacterium]|nr:RluA family pseudouridine synthase [Polyangia bacterium]